MVLIIIIYICTHTSRASSNVFLRIYILYDGKEDAPGDPQKHI